MKTGRLSKSEQDYIKANYSIKTYEQLATELDRRVEPIREFIEKKLGKNISFQDERELHAEYDIKSRPFWTDLQNQFDETELEMVVYHWKRIVGQFKDDVFPTEELQILDVVKLEILMNRLLTEQNNTKRNISSMEDILNLEYKKDIADQDANLIINAQTQLSGLRASQETGSKEYREVLGEKNKILKEMKATREQRIKRVEDSRQSFTGYMSNLLMNTDLRRSLGISMEKMRLAMYKERERLGQYHRFEDGMIDQPILCVDTIIEEN
jgi:hypothetical protein